MVNELPFFLALVYGIADGRGDWLLGANVGPGAAGVDITFQTFALSSEGELLRSNQGTRDSRVGKQKNDFSLARGGFILEQPVGATTERISKIRLCELAPTSASEKPLLRQGRRLFEPALAPARCD